MVDSRTPNSVTLFNVSGVPVRPIAARAALPPAANAAPHGSNAPLQSAPEAAAPAPLLDHDPPPQVAIIEEPAPEEPEEDDPPRYDVPIILNASVEAHIDYFNTRIRDKFELWLSRSGRYLPLMRDIFRTYGLPEDLVFVALIESGV